MLPEQDTDTYLRINEIKNYVYCPRIPFYVLCMHMDRETAVSKIGIEQETIVKSRMKRRKYALHAVHDGIRLFDVPVVLHQLRLIGRIDEVVETDAGIYIIDYKDTDQDYGYWKTQLCAYRMGMVEAGFHVLGCYVYTIPNQHYEAIKLTKRDEQKLETIAAALNHISDTQLCPEPTPHTRKCYTCQYERFCNDVL